MGIIEKLNFTSEKTLPVIRQSEVAECGLACIGMIASYHGHKVDLNYLRRTYSLSSKGANLESLIAVGDKLGLSSRALRLEMNELKELQTPCILHWGMNHFVVLKKVLKNSIQIHDPAIGFKTVKFDVVSKEFTGIALELRRKQEFTPKKSVRKPRISMFWSRVSGLKSALIQICVLSLILQLGTLAAPYYTQIVIDDILIAKDLNFLKVVAIGFAGLAVFMGIVEFFRSRVILYLSNQLGIQIAANLFSHLIRLPLEYFEKRHIGDVVSRFGSVSKIKELISTSIIETFVDGVMSIGLLIMVFVYSPKLAIITIITTTILAALKLALFSKYRQLNENEIVTEAKQDTNFMETVRAIQTVKLLGNENKREVLWFDKFADYINASIRTDKFLINFKLLNTIVFGLEGVFVIYLAALQIVGGAFTVGMLFAYLAYKAQLIIKTSNLIDKAIEFRMIGLHLERVGDIALNEKEDLDETSFDPSKLNGQLDLKDITYKYSEIGQPVINKFSLSVRQGESVAITGRSGCGKTTLIKLMLGLFEPNSGEIYIDGINIKTVGKTNYRKIVGSVMQDDQLFSGTLFENISFFDPDASAERVMECARLASIHDDIMDMPMSYDTLVGDMGSTLSGGQKQRVILARALYQKPKILFLDEATSHLDTEHERYVNKAISELNITRVIVAHRKETINSCDRVIALG